MLNACYGSNWQSNPDAKVDVVAHCMGGLVVRAAIKWYNLPCGEPVRNRIRKLLLIATPNKGCHFKGDCNLIQKICFGHSDWQTHGEDLEMNVDPSYFRSDVYFEDNNGNKKRWCDFLDPNDDCGVPTAVIAGARPGDKALIFIALFGAAVNDNMVLSDWVKMSCAKFNPVVYSSHGVGDYAENSDETFLQGCTYVTEFIKKWIIDDIEDKYYGAQVLEYAKVYPWTEDERPPYALRINPGIDDYKKALIVLTKLKGYSKDKGWRDVGPWKAFHIYKYSKGCPGDPVYWRNSEDSDVPLDATSMQAEIYVQDMKEGIINMWGGQGTLDWDSNPGAYVKVVSPKAGEWYKPGYIIPIKWESNDKAVKQDLYISYDGGKHWKEIAKDLPGNVREYNKYRVEEHEQKKGEYAYIKVRFYLDPFTYIEGISPAFRAGWWLKAYGIASFYPYSGFFNEGYDFPHVDSIIPTATAGDSCKAWLEWEWWWSRPWNFNEEYEVFRNTAFILKTELQCVEIHTKTGIHYVQGDTMDTPENGCYGCGILSNPVSIICPSKPPDSSGCPFVYVWNGGSYEIDNNILRVAVRDSASPDHLDFYKLNHIPVNEDGKYLLQIKEFEQEHSYINQVLLHAVDHPEGTEIGVTGYGGIIIYDPASVILPVEARDMFTHDILSYLTGEDNLFFAGKAEEWITLKFSCPGYRLTGGEIYFGIRDRARDKRSIVVEVYEDTTWKIAGILHPRENWQYEFLPLTSFIPGDTLVLRLKFTSYHEVDKVFLVNSSGNGIIKECPLDFAFHSVEGDITQEVKNSDDMYSELTPGEEISLLFTVPSLPEKDMKRDFIFISSGYYEVMDGYGGPQEVIKSSFPFRLYSIPVVVGRKSIEIKYSLPYKSQVRLCVYDVNGRLIKEIFKEERKKGIYSLIWDRRDENGKYVSAGIYFVYLEAGDKRDIRKVVILK